MNIMNTQFSHVGCRSQTAPRLEQSIPHHPEGSEGSASPVPRTIRIRRLRLLSFFIFHFSFFIAPGIARAQRQENLPDIDVLYIERTPRYPGYRVDYDRPGSQGVPIL